MAGPPRAAPAGRLRRGGASVLAHGVDQVQRAGFPGLAAQGEAAREVVEDVQRAHGAREALLVGDIEVAGQALAQGEGRAGGALAARALEADLVQAQVAGDLAAVVAPAAEQGQRGLLEQGAFGAARGGVAAHDTQESFSASGISGSEYRRTRGALAVPCTCTPARTAMFGRSARMSSEGLA